jgi:hypothetical protein
MLPGADLSLSKRLAPVASIDVVFRSVEQKQTVRSSLRRMDECFRGSGVVQSRKGHRNVPQNLLRMRVRRLRGAGRRGRSI